MKNDPDIVKKLRSEEEKGILTNDLSVIFDETSESDIEKKEKSIDTKNNGSKTTIILSRNNIFSEEKFTRLINYLPDGLIIVNESGKILEVNTALYKMVGYTSKNDFFNNIQSVAELIPKKEHQRLIKGLQNTFEKGYDRNQYHAIKKDNSQIFVDIHAKLYTDETVKSLSIVIVRDITEKKNAEDRYKTLYESSQDAIMTLEPPTWKFTSGNTSTLRIFNVESETAFTKLGPWNVSPEYQPDGTPSADKAKKMIQKAMQEGSNYFEWTHKRVNGEEFAATVLLTRIELEGKQLLQATVRDVSNEKIAEQRLKENERKLNLILENMPAGIILIDPEKHEILELNKYASDMIGLPKDKISGKLCQSFICPAEKGECPVTDLGKTVDKSEKIIIDKNGVEKPILKTVIPINIGDKDLLLESFVDISKMKEAEKNLKESKNQSELLLNASADGIRIVDKNFKIQKINDTLEKMSNVPSEKQIGLTCKDILKSEFCGTEECSLVKSIRDGESFQREQIMTCTNGKQIPVLSKITPLKDKKGNVTGIIEDYRDISSVKQAKTKLQANEKKFRQFFESSPDYCYMVSTDGTILDINSSAIEILGLEKKEDVLDKQIIPTVYSDPGRANELVKKWQKQGYLRNEKIKIKSQKGKRTVLLSVDNVKDSDGKLSYSILMQKDVTEFLKVEEDLKNKIDELQKYKKVTIGRELKMVELKKQIKELEEKCMEEKTID